MQKKRTHNWKKTTGCILLWKKNIEKKRSVFRMDHPFTHVVPKVSTSSTYKGGARSGERFLHFATGHVNLRQGYLEDGPGSFRVAGSDRGSNGRSMQHTRVLHHGNLRSTPAKCFPGNNRPLYMPSKGDDGDYPP